MRIELTVNGQARELEGHSMDRLLDLLREQLGLTGTKEGCGEGECGACTVLVEGQPVLSCLVPLMQCAGIEVQTVEGVAADAEAGEFLDRFVGAGGVQCGACTPGIIVASWALLCRKPSPSRAEVQEALAGNLCRCTGYEAIFRSFTSARDQRGVGREEE